MILLRNRLQCELAVAGLLLFGAAAGAADLNRSASVKLMGLPPGDPAVAVCERLAEGLAIQAVITIPSASQPGGDLLDPQSLEMMIDDQPLLTYLLYKTPNLGVAFGVPQRALETPPSELSLTVRLLGEPDIAAGWRLPLSPTADQAARMARPAERQGRQVLILDEAGLPFVGARFFGQRREDLFAVTGADGLVVLDAPSRGSLELHYAWAPGTWMNRFNTMENESTTLTSRDGSTRSRRFDLTMRAAGGVRIDRALLLVNDLDWVEWQAERSVTVPIRKGGPNYIHIIAPGFLTKPIELDERATGRIVWMDRLPEGSE